MTPQRGDIWWVSLDPTQGSEIRKTRPCLVLTANTLNRLRQTVVVVPLSTAARAHPPITVPVTCQGQAPHRAMLVWLQAALVQVQEAQGRSWGSCWGAEGEATALSQTRTSGGIRAKTYGFAQQENLRLSNNWILIFAMGFLVDFQPE